MNSDLEQKKERNREQRKKFVKKWAQYVKNHSDEE